MRKVSSQILGKYGITHYLKIAIRSFEFLLDMSIIFFLSVLDTFATLKNSLVLHELVLVLLEQFGVESYELHVTAGCRVVVAAHLVPVPLGHRANQLVDVHAHRSYLLLQGLMGKIRNRLL